MAQAHGIGIVAHSPLGGGFLTGKYKPGQPPPPDSRFAAHPGGISSLPQHYDLMMTEPNLRVVETVRTLAQVYDTTPSAIALAWVLAKPFVSSAIIGPKNPMQLEDNLAAADVTLTPEEVCTARCRLRICPQPHTLVSAAAHSGSQQYYAFLRGIALLRPRFRASRLSPLHRFLPAQATYRNRYGVCLGSAIGLLLKLCRLLASLRRARRE